jgi:hypothetical protein
MIGAIHKQNKRLLLYGERGWGGRRKEVEYTIRKKGAREISRGVMGKARSKGLG